TLNPSATPWFCSVRRLDSGNIYVKAAQELPFSKSERNGRGRDDVAPRPHFLLSSKMRVPASNLRNNSRNKDHFMISKKSVCLFIAMLWLVSSSLPIALADEGMWPFNNIPRAEIKRRYGFEVTDDWLKKVQLGSVRFNNGGSGSFVSPDGLVLTNHH